MDAMPFSNAAKRVSVVEVCAQKDERDGLARLNDVVRYLGRHRITAEAQPIIHCDRSDAEHLFEFALDEGADLLVAGAYGHSRLGEWMFAVG
jgi:nucleotide-binding universal stress UspA family protein